MSTPMPTAADNGISAALAGVLRSGRPEFNAQFAEARRIYPDLDGVAFGQFLRDEVDALSRAVAKENPDRVADVVAAAYDTGLALVGQKLIGPGARTDVVAEGWRRVLAPAAGLVAGMPYKMLTSVSNALYNLAVTPGAKPSAWIEIMERLGPQCSDADAFLCLGQLAAWRSGLAHFRLGALSGADALPQHLAVAVLGAPDSTTWPELKAALLANPWFDPSVPPISDGKSHAHLRVALQAGAFRGFGGLFAKPPIVAATDGYFVARSGEDYWLLTADVFGATFHRATPADFQMAQQQGSLPAGLRISDTRLIWDGEKFEIPSLGKFTSAAANAHTLAVTAELTHSIVLLALKTS